MNLDAYRKAVIESVACTFCLSEVGELCVRMPAPGATELLVGYLHYVHDDRSLAFHHRANQALRAWLEDPRLIEHVPLALLADLDQLVADLESGDARFQA